MTNSIHTSSTNIILYPNTLKSHTSIIKLTHDHSPKTLTGKAILLSSLRYKKITLLGKKSSPARKMSGRQAGGRATNRSERSPYLYLTHSARHEGGDKSARLSVQSIAHSHRHNHHHQPQGERDGEWK